MSASETVRRHTFGSPEDMGPPALERAAHQLMVQEANRRLAAEKSIEELNAELAKAKSAAQASETGRIAAEAKIGELTAELAKRGEAYRAALADYDTKLSQAREGRSTADLLAAQAKAEAIVANGAVEMLANDVAEMRKMCNSMMEQMQTMQMDEPESPQDAPVSYRLNVIGRDAAGDLRTVEIIPVERT